MKKKQMMTWSLRIQNDDYRHDYERYGNKITSIGLHDWDVDAQGRIAIYKLGPTKDDFGSYISWTDATTYDRYAKNTSGGYSRPLWPVYIEPDMKRWPHIEYYMQMVIFGPETVSRLLDTPTYQDNFINNLKTVVARFRVDQAGNDLGYAGIEIDCEGSWSDNKWDSRVGDDVKFIDLLKRIKNEVIIDDNPDFKLRINAHAMWGAGVPDYFRFHNYKLFADSVDKQGNQLIDEIQLMSYDFAWSGSAPGPSTPLWWMEDIAKWCNECFNPVNNPNAKLTIDQVYMGGAGYGRRWPIYSEDTFGSSVTYRNLVDWQNGYYIHHRGGGEMADQDFIPQNAINDPNSDNQIMYNHQYDYFKAKDMKRETSMGQTTARLSEYNGIEFVTSYSKNQHMKLGGIRSVVGVTGVSEPAHNLGAVIPPVSPRRSQTATMTLGGQEYQFQAYETKRVPYVPTDILDENQQVIDQVCQKSTQPETILSYTVNVPTAGQYRIGALVSFPFYGQTKLNGQVAGESFTIGGSSIPDFYPMMFKGVHVWDVGTKTLNAGSNTIEIHGLGSEHGTIIFGFVVADTMELEVIGGNMTAPANVQPFTKRDGTPAKMPNELAFTNEVLQQAPRPVIMWEDFFRQFLTDPTVQGTDNEGNPITKNRFLTGLQATTYYRLEETFNDQGGGTQETWTNGVLTGCYETKNRGFSQGYWEVIKDEDGTACAHFYPTNPLNGGPTSGQLVLNYTYKELNISAEVQFKLMSGVRAGVRFASTGPGDGYLFLVDYDTQTVMLALEQARQITTILASASLGDRTVEYGERVQMKVQVNGTKARCTIGGLNLLGDQDVTMSPGGMGFYATNCDAYLYMMSLGSTSRWETLERFEITYTDALGAEVTQKLGEIPRPGITRDQYGYLNYSGFNEINTRQLNPDGTRPEISLDYVFKPVYIPTFTGPKDIKIKLVDAGLWYKMLYIGDKEGMSIMYAGDEESFNRAMNIAVYDYNCKGIGLWVLGQADPRIFETLPDVVPWHE